MYQTGIYKLSLTKLSQSDCLISVPAQQLPPSPNMPPLLPSHIYKLTASPVVVSTIRPLEYFFLSGSCQSMALETES